MLLALTLALLLSLAFGGALVFASSNLPALSNQSLNGAAVGHADDDPDDEKGPKDGAYCSGEGDKLHPTGEKLAQRYSESSEEPVTYTEIMTWFCDYGYGFGEINLAYGISLAKGVPVSEVFDKRASGMGWGNILKEYGLDKKPDKPPKPPKPDNGNGGGNGNGNADNNGNAYGHDKNKGNNGNHGGQGKP
jgi:hypothetical protein